MLLLRLMLLLRPLSSLSSSRFRSFGGQLASIKAPQLGAVAIKGAVERAGIPPEYVQVNMLLKNTTRQRSITPRPESTSPSKPMLKVNTPISMAMLQEAYLGSVCQANLGQAPARQAVMAGGLSQSCIA